MAQERCTVADVIEAVANLAPPELAESWDNVGFQLGNQVDPVGKTDRPETCVTDGSREIKDLRVPGGDGFTNTSARGEQGQAKKD